MAIAADPFDPRDDHHLVDRYGAATFGDHHSRMGDDLRGDIRSLALQAESYWTVATRRLVPMPVAFCSTTRLGLEVSPFPAT